MFACLHGDYRYLAEEQPCTTRALHLIHAHVIPFLPISRNMCSAGFFTPNKPPAFNVQMPSMPKVVHPLRTLEIGFLSAAGAVGGAKEKLVTMSRTHAANPHPVTQLLVPCQDVPTQVADWAISLSWCLGQWSIEKKTVTRGAWEATFIWSKNWPHGSSLTVNVEPGKVAKKEKAAQSSKVKESHDER